MTHDPYQSYPTFAYPGLTNQGLANPFSSPYTAIQTAGVPWGIPQAGIQPFATQGYPGGQGIGGQSNYGQQLQLSPFTNAWQNPFAGALQNPFMASPIQLQNPMVHPILAQLAASLQPYSPFQQGYQQQHHQQQIGQVLAALGQQQGGPFNSPLAPQSWIGQAGGNQGYGQGYGQINPVLMQLAARALQGASPWGGF